jgi:predicted NBD/HSP70 family sugar kinase
MRGSIGTPTQIIGSRRWAKRRKKAKGPDHRRIKRDRLMASAKAGDSQAARILRREFRLKVIVPCK